MPTSLLFAEPHAAAGNLSPLTMMKNEAVCSLGYPQKGCANKILQHACRVLYQ